jgi:hypothetical protein
MLETPLYSSLRPNLIAIMLAWCVLVILEFTLFVFISRSAFHNLELPLGAQLLLFSESVTLLTFVTFVIGAALTTGGIATPENPGRAAYMVAQTPDAYQYGIVRAGFKLIFDERLREHRQFNLKTDPGEKQNLASTEPLIVKKLATRLNTWRKLQIDYYSAPTVQ